MKIPGIPLAIITLAVFTAVGSAAMAAPVLSTSFETETFVDPQRLDLPLKNWFEFAARHREDGGRGSGEGGASAWIVDKGARSGKRVLLLELSDIEKSRRSEFNVWPPDDIAKEFSVSVWLRLPEDFALQAPGIDWNWMEFCVLASEEVSDKSGKRWSYLRLMLGQPDITKPEFNISLGGRKGPQHEQFVLGRINDFALPRGRWFNVHYCLKRDTEKGRVKVWVDGNPVFDFHDLPTTEDGGSCKIAPAKLYYEPTDKESKMVWVDDLTIWGGWVEPSLPPSESN